ncbi:MAG: hypothetical protein ACRC68_12470 [Clostridium sp.]
MTSVYGAFNFFLKVVVRNKSNKEINNIVFACKENSRLLNRLKKIKPSCKELVLVDNTGYEGLKPLYIIIDETKYLISDSLEGDWNGSILIDLNSYENSTLDFTVDIDYKEESA